MNPGVTEHNPASAATTGVVTGETRASASQFATLETTDWRPINQKIH